MTGKFFCILASAGVLLLSVPCVSQARTWDTSVQPAFFQGALKAAGIFSERIAADPGTGYPCAVYLRDFHGSEVTVGFPSTGLRRGIPFLLAIDGMAAIVKCSDDGKLAIVAGDERIASSGVFDIIGCILSNALESVGDLIEAIGDLNVVGILQAVAKLVFGIFNCDF
jgi:hypothetical protein